jgi:protein-disulfide isomerase
VFTRYEGLGIFPAFKTVEHVVMKKLIVPVILGLLFAAGCQKNNSQVAEQIAKLEQRIEVLEKRLSAAPAQQQQGQAQAEQTQAYDLPVGSSYVMGNPSAPITLTKFSDYQCPFCERAHSTFVEKILEDPKLKDNVKIVFKHFPLSFHKNARAASKAALAAGEQGHDCFWQMTKKLYTGQRELTDENYKKWAKETKCKDNSGKVVALDVAKFEKDYKNNDEKYEKMIKEDMDLGMNKASVRGTPSFFLNGWKLSQRSVEAVKQMIEEKGMLTGGQAAAKK